MTFVQADNGMPKATVIVNLINLSLSSGVNLSSISDSIINRMTTAVDVKMVTGNLSKLRLMLFVMFSTFMDNFI